MVDVSDVVLLGNKVTVVVTVLSHPFCPMRFWMKTPANAGSQVVLDSVVLLLGNKVTVVVTVLSQAF